MNGVNFEVRIKNPWFWVGIVGVLATALGLSPENVTSWESLWNALCVAGGNPSTLVAAAMALLGVLVDPTTAGISDSKQALLYSSPKVSR